jgi:hypothetical protein
MKSAVELGTKAKRYRRMAAEFTDQQTIEALKELATRHEMAADALDNAAEMTNKRSRSEEPELRSCTSWGTRCRSSC